MNYLYLCLNFLTRNLTNQTLKILNKNNRLQYLNLNKEKENKKII